MGLARLFFALSFLFLSACASLTGSGKTCETEPSLFAKRAVELQKIAKADQEDRVGDPNAIITNTDKLLSRDVLRRKRVAEIFAEGCFKEAADYAAGALVFQHGTTPDHYMQSFMWARKAVALGDDSQKQMMAMSMDRYLVNSGYRQLFATQFSKPDEKSCWCLEKVEETFPDDLRAAYTKRSLKGALMLGNSLNHDPKCKTQNMCTKKLKYPPRGSMPGIW